MQLSFVYKNFISESENELQSSSPFYIILNVEKCKSKESGSSHANYFENNEKNSDNIGDDSSGGNGGICYSFMFQHSMDVQYLEQFVDG